MSKYYYTPTTTIELAEWLSRYYSENVSKYLKMGKKRLYAIYFTVRDGKVKGRRNTITGTAGPSITPKPLTVPSTVYPAVPDCCNTKWENMSKDK